MPQDAIGPTFLQVSSAYKVEAGKGPHWPVTLTVPKVRSQQENDAVGRKVAGASDPHTA